MSLRTREGLAVWALGTLLATSALEAQGITLTTASPATLGLDTLVLRQAGDSADRLPALLSLLVWRHGALGYELYLHGGSRDSAVNVKSVSKTFLSALIGIALAGRNLDQPISEILPEHYRPAAGTLFADVRARTDSARRMVTLRQLLTMSGGLAWSESDPMLTYALVTSGNPVRLAAELPVLTPPGSSFNYTTAGTHLLAGALTRLTGTSNRELGEQRLFGPAGIRLARWDADPQGVHFGGSEMFFTTREILKLGILYLRRGKVGDRQVVPVTWVTESWKRHHEVSTPAYRQMVPGLTGYGYLWWLRTSAGRPMMCALGLGGQFVLVVPDLELVLAGTSALDGRNPGNERQFNAIFEIVDRIVGAAR